MTMTMVVVAAAAAAMTMMINPLFMAFLVAVAIMPMMLPDHVKDGAHDDDDACHYIHHSACEDAYDNAYNDDHISGDSISLVHAC